MRVVLNRMQMHHLFSFYIHIIDRIRHANTVDYTSGILALRAGFVSLILT